MIKGHEKFRIPDQAKVGDFFAEVNWNPKDPKTNDCKFVRFTFPDGSSATVDRDHLHAILFAIGNEEQQRKLIPKVDRTVRKYETVVSVKATKDIRKGEEITFPLSLNLPEITEEKIGTAPKEQKVLTPRG
jgi:hypothetical protein